MKINLKKVTHEHIKTPPETLSGVVFGTIFSDHMFCMEWDEGKGWHSAQIKPYGALSLEPSSMVLHYAQMAFDAGLDGVVCSAYEAPLLRKQFPHDFLLVTPGIVCSDVASSDQKRIVTPGEAIVAGADYLVIGRSITLSSDPLARLQDCNRLFS